MSRIGKKPIEIPHGVLVHVEGDRITVKGPKGELSRVIHPDIRAVVKDTEIQIEISRNTKRASALWGLTRSLIANMVAGVVKEFEKKLEFEGIGYRVASDAAGLTMQLGFSHPVKFPLPIGIIIKVEKNVITISGIDKELVGETAARIRSLKPPEPYKGKGIRYQGEVIRRKAGKKAVSSA